MVEADDLLSVGQKVNISGVKEGTVTGVIKGLFGPVYQIGYADGTTDEQQFYNVNRLDEWNKKKAEIDGAREAVEQERRKKDLGGLKEGKHRADEYRIISFPDAKVTFGKCADIEKDPKVSGADEVTNFAVRLSAQPRSGFHFYDHGFWEQTNINGGFSYGAQGAKEYDVEGDRVILRNYGKEEESRVFWRNGRLEQEFMFPDWGTMTIVYRLEEAEKSDPETAEAQPKKKVLYTTNAEEREKNKTEAHPAIGAKRSSQRREW